MSWIESHADFVGSYDLTQLKVDQAILNVSSNYERPLWLYQLSTNCLQCPYKLVDEIASLDMTDSVKTISTTFPMKYRIRTSGNETYVPEDNDSHTFCDISPNFGEFGVYELKAGGTVGDPTCEVTTVLDPVNIYFPLLIAFIVFFLLEVLLWAINNYEKILPAKVSLKFKGGGGRNRESSIITGQLDDTDTRNVNLNASSSSRLSSVDTFRGIAILLMIWVHDGGASYNFMQHAAWDGLTVADLILPWFIWIMGVCIPISLKSVYKKNVETKIIIKKVAIRAFKLLAIGLMMNTIGSPAVDLRFYRFFAILQRLAVSSLVANLLAILCLKSSFKTQNQNYFRRNSTSPLFRNLERLYIVFKDILVLWKGWLVILLLIGVHTCVIFFLEIPGCPTGYLGPAGLHENGKYPARCIGGATGYVDRKIWGDSHIYKWPTANDVYAEGAGVPFDPEGTLGYLTTFLQVWSGVQAGMTLLTFNGQGQGNWANWNMVIRWGAWGVLQGLVSGLLCDFKQTGGAIPVNKNLYSLSFVLVTNALAFWMLCILYILVDWLKIWNGSPLKEPGQNSILLYIVHLVIQKMFPWHWAYGDMQSHFIRLVESLWGISLWVCVAFWLVRKKIFLKI